MQTHHTPGPWFTEALSTIGHCAIVDADGFTIANPSPMGQANARLIAAAPDLLAALQSALDQLSALSFADDRIVYARERARAAIARATGQ